MNRLASGTVWLVLRVVKSRLFWTVLGCVLLMAAGYHVGIAREKSAQAKRVVLAQAQVKKTEARAQVITSNVRTRNDRAQTEIRYITKEIIKKVPQYVTPEADARCVVPTGFVSLHDAAATGDMSGLAGSAGADEPSGIALSAVSTTVVDNYGTALGWRREAEAWREWYQRQAANR